MAKIYSGRVVIPGDKIEEYFELLKAAEEERAPFLQHLMAAPTASKSGFPSHSSAF